MPRSVWANVCLFHFNSLVFVMPGVLKSAKSLQASLPLDVQTILARAEASPDLLADPTFTLRVAFLPTLPASGRNPDAVAYFVKPGEVPDELEDLLNQYIVLPKVGMASRPNLAASQVMAEVARRTAFKFHSQHHTHATRLLEVRPPKGEGERTLKIEYAEYITSFKRWLYTQAWIDRLVKECESAEGFEATTGRVPQPLLPGHEADEQAPPSE